MKNERDALAVVGLDFSGALHGVFIVRKLGEHTGSEFNSVALVHSNCGHACYRFAFQRCKKFAYLLSRLVGRTLDSPARLFANRHDARFLKTADGEILFAVGLKCLGNTAFDFVVQLTPATPLANLRARATTRTYGQRKS